MPYDRLIIPAGKAAGCLPRASKIGAVCGMASEHIEIVPQAEWPALIDAPGDGPDDYVREIFDQDGVNSCGWESITQTIQIVENMAGQPDAEKLNPWFGYYHTSHGTDQGSSLDENMLFARENGVASDRAWPRYDEAAKILNPWDRKPSEAAYEDAESHKIDEFYDVVSTLEIGSCLLAKFPLVFGWQGHSCVLTKLISKTHAKYVNSWGDWGDNGRGIIALAAVDFRYGCFAVRTAVY